MHRTLPASRRCLVKYPLALALLLTVLSTFNSLGAQSNDELQRNRSWQPPTHETIQAVFDQWMAEAKFKEPIRAQVRGILDVARDQFRSENSLELALNAMIAARPDLQQVRESLERRYKPGEFPNFDSVLNNQSEQPFVRNHVRLLNGRWLAQNDYFDESLVQLNQIALSDVVDPASMLFYKSLAEHQLLRKEECLTTVEQLLENADALPKRFAVVARLMFADIEPMESDSMDEIARMMNDIQRRQSLYRAGKRVRVEEQEVIEKLDKVIKKIEAAQQKMSQKKPGSGGSSTKPLEDSKAASDMGDGEVTRKKQTDGGQWGDLPAADRAAAMAEMAKDLPPHYRSVIEEYFRKLAEEKDR